MKTCPTCGNRYRPDVTECPNDGTKLVPGPAAPAPPAGPPAVAPPPGGPPRASKPAAPAPARSGYSHEEIATSLTEKSTASSWIASLVVILLLFGVFFVARESILGPSEAGPDANTEEPTVKTKKKKGKRKKRPKRSPGSNSNEPSFDDYDWEQDYEVDDSELGDVQPDPGEFEVVESPREPEPYDPKPSEWQSGGSYKPTARWSEPGADTNVVELDLSTRSSSAPLDETQVKSVLDERKLARCYDPWVQKIPQMRGRVDMTFIVAPDGHVASVKVTRSQLRSQVVESCLVQKARGFRFPRATGGARTKFDTHFDFTNH